MKVDAAAPGGAFRATQITSARGGQSFASMLAGGRSIAEIKSGRALGFSETGLFGAAHESVGKGAAKAAVVEPALVARERAVDAATVLARQPTRSSGNAQAGQKPGVVPPQTPDGLAAKAPATRVGATAAATLANRVRAIAEHSPAAPVVSGRRKHLRTRSLRPAAIAISGADDQLTVSIGAAEDTLSLSALYLDFSRVAQSFGVTMAVIVVEGRRVGFVQLVA